MSVPVLTWPQALARGLPVVWLVETDMRQGWPELLAAEPAADWRLAVRSVAEKLANGQPGWVDDAATTVPYHKDAAFRRVSLECVLRGFGATEEAPMLEPEQERVGNN